MSTPVFYEKLVSAAVMVLSGNLPDGQAEKVAADVATKFCRENCGDIHRIPSLKSHSKKERDKAIRLDSQTMTRAQLKSKYGVSESVIKRVCRK